MLDAGRTDRILKLAILAVGGQGGGVLTNWITDLARAEGWQAQSTVVAGVAQRTGATIYYVELAPDTARPPVFALAPAPGDVDVLIAAEWMEAGRAVLRGFVTPDRTTVIASTHRMLSTAEKMVPGDGRADGADVTDALDTAAARVLAFDMDRPARDAGSMISATLFGAIAHAGVLPFAPERFEAVIADSGHGAEASLAAFRAGLAGPPAPEPVAPPVPTLPTEVAGLPEPVQQIAAHGWRRVVDFQDRAYGAEYLDRLAPFLEIDRSPDRALAQTAAKYLANAMAYDDVIRVADLKTRATRFERLRTEHGAHVRVTEYFHPRIEEVCGALPARLGAWIEARPRLHAWLGRRIDRGRRIRSTGLAGFLTLYLVAGLRPWRRRLLRHRVEMAHLDAWSARAREVAPGDADLAIEILACRRLIKGYSDTHARGHSKFDRVLEALEMLDGRSDAAAWLARLREAALQDEAGTALDGALKTVASFAAEEA